MCFTVSHWCPLGYCENSCRPVMKVSSSRKNLFCQVPKEITNLGMFYTKSKAWGCFLFWEGFVFFLNHPNDGNLGCKSSRKKKVATCNFTFLGLFFSPVLLNTKAASFVMPWPSVCG